MPLLPDIEFSVFGWDADPPFEAPSRHRFTATYTNLRPFDVAFRAEFYVNGELFKTASYSIGGGDTSLVTEEYTFNIEGTYTITVKAYYDDLLLDEISSTVNVVAPPPVEVIDGKLLVAYARWEGKPSYSQILTENEWPANTSIYTAWKVENTGNITASFNINFMGQSSAITLVPGESGWVLLTINTGSPGSYSYTMSIYGDGKLVESTSLNVTTY